MWHSFCSIFGGGDIEHNICVFFFFTFTTTVVRKISLSEKNLPRYYHDVQRSSCEVHFIQTDGQIDKHEEANSRFSPFCERAVKKRSFCVSFSFEIPDVRSSSKVPASYAGFAASIDTAFDISS